MAIVWVIVGAIITGIIIGGLARLVLPGKQNMSLPITIVIGIVAAFVGGMIAHLFGIGSGEGFNLFKFLIQIAVGALGVFLYAGRS